MSESGLSDYDKGRRDAMKAICVALRAPEQCICYDVGVHQCPACNGYLEALADEIDRSTPAG